MRKIMIIAVLSLIILSFLGVFGYFVAKGLLELGYPSLVVAGALLIIIGGLVATNRAEKIAEMNNQLSIQAWYMEHAVVEGEILQPAQLDVWSASVPTTWHVRKQDDGLGYSILPLIKGAPQWDLAILTNVEDPVDAHRFADSATRRSITA